MTPDLFFVISLGLFGLLFGSFGNVIIWRLPRGESLVRPASHCPACGHEIRWCDNVPVLSWLLLRGRCRDCGIAIPVRYALIEAGSGVLFALAGLRFGIGARAVVAALLFWLLLVLSAIDLDHMRLPNSLVAVVAGLGVTGALAAQVTGQAVTPLIGMTGGGALATPLGAAITGLVLGAGLSGGLAASYAALRGRQGLGMGDVKLLGALGLHLGPFVLMTIVIGSFIGAVAGIVAARGHALSKVRLPFGPSLAAGGVITALIGPDVWAWYLRLVGIG